MNGNLAVWTSDWHVVSDDVEHGIVNETRPTQAGQVAAHIASLDPAVVIDTGDCKDHYGASSADEHDRYIEHVRDVLPSMKILPGNHDEVHDFNEAGGSVTDFLMWDAKFWGAPYHWTVDWPAPQIRFIGIHTTIVHTPTPLAGFFSVETAEVGWLEAELAGLPYEWQAIVCSHGPANPAFGTEIRSTLGGTQLRALLAVNAGKIAAYLNGHRHSNMETGLLDGIRHFNGPGMSYTLGNGYGGWVPITYDPVLRTLTFDYLLGPPSTYPRVNGYTPIVVQLPTLTGPPPLTPLEQAVAELKLTTVGYINDYWTDPPEDTHWRNALDILETV